MFARDLLILIAGWLLDVENNNRRRWFIARMRMANALLKVATWMVPR